MTASPIRLLQIFSSQSLLADFCNKIGTKPPSGWRVNAFEWPVSDRPLAGSSRPPLRCFPKSKTIVLIYNANTRI